MAKYRKNSKITPEVEEKIKNKNYGLLEKINVWQTYPKLKSLTCEKCSTKVIGKIKGFKVLLECPNCGHISKNIPKEVLQANFNSKLSILLKNKERNNRFIEKLKDY